MQQVNQTGLRLGSATGWIANRHEKGDVSVNWRYVDQTRKALAKRGMFCINNYTYNHRGVQTHVVIYYRYLQRSKLNRWLVQALRRREGQMAKVPVRSRIFYKLDLTSTKSAFTRKLVLRKAFPAVSKVEKQVKRRKWVPPHIWKKMTFEQREAHNAKFKQQPKESGLVAFKQKKLVNQLRGWADLEWQMYNLYKVGQTERLNNQLRQMYDQLFVGRSEVLLYNIMQFVPLLNPLVTTRYYVFKRFGNLMYQADLVQTVYLAIYLNLSRLLSHTIVLGLERHAQKRSQRRFVAMLKATVERLTTWSTLQQASFVCRISIYGKLDAKMRRTHLLLKFGETQYQQVNFITSATKQTSRTKYGTSTIQIWLRNTSGWKAQEVKVKYDTKTKRF
jgi:hypothetical protein